VAASQPQSVGIRWLADGGHLGDANAVFYAVAAVGSPPEDKRWGQLIAGAIGVLIAMRLERRFRPYLADPPELSAEESPSEARLVFWFRAVCYAVFGGICLIGLLLRESGVQVLQGF
jgi:uncharacterized membrane protein HdeD (DUF308 family)